MPLRGASVDFYWESGSPAVRTDPSLALEAALANGWQGAPMNMARFNTLTGAEVDTGWARDAFGNWATTVGNNGVLCPVVADKTYFEDGPYDNGVLPLANVRTVVEGVAQSAVSPQVWAQIGNEWYIGASGTHGELTQAAADRAIAVAQAIKTAYPQVKTIAPSMGTFRELAVADCLSKLKENWRAYCYFFRGHAGAFDMLGGNLYKWDVNTTPPDISNNGFRKGRQMLESAAGMLSLQPVITELGVVGGNATGLVEALTVAGSRFPTFLWKCGPGDSYDMIAGGAMPVPEI